MAYELLEISERKRNFLLEPGAHQADQRADQYAAQRQRYEPKTARTHPLAALEERTSRVRH